MPNIIIIHTDIYPAKIHTCLLSYTFFIRLKVNETTMRQRLKAGSVTKSVERFQRTFSRQQEPEIVTFLKDMDDVFLGCQRECLMEISISIRRTK